MTNRQKMTRRVIGSGLLMLVCVAALLVRSALFSEQASAENAPQERAPLVVSVMHAERRDRISLKRDFTGEIRAARESQLSFERSGRITSISVDEGSTVHSGQELARVDVDRVVAQIDATNGQLSQANAVLDELLKGPRKETIAAAKATLASLEAIVQRLQADFDRSEKLFQSATISRERFDRTKFQLESSIASRDASQRQLDELLAGTRVEQIDAQRAVVAQIEAQIKSLELDKEDGILLSPFAGRIAERMVDEGTVVAPGTAAFRIVEDSSLEVWVGVPRSVARQLSIGDEHTITVGDRSIKGTVASLRPSLDPVTRTQNVILQLTDSAADSCVPGEIARLSILEDVQAEGVTVPTSALVPGPRGLWNVFTVDESSESPVVQQKSVELLYSLGETSLVRGTVGEGDVVVLDGVHRVVSGQRVQPKFSEERD